MKLAVEEQGGWGDEGRGAGAQGGIPNSGSMGACGIPNSQCPIIPIPPMPNAQCPMPSIQQGDLRLLGIL